MTKREVEVMGPALGETRSAVEEPLFTIVINDEDQYSIWPAERALPLGWERRGAARSREQCLDEIEEIWTDMRPRSVREWQEANLRSSDAPQ